jgi:hypothetical protein
LQSGFWSWRGRVWPPTRFPYGATSLVSRSDARRASSKRHSGSDRGRPSWTRSDASKGTDPPRTGSRSLYP